MLEGFHGVPHPDHPALPGPEKTTSTLMVEIKKIMNWTHPRITQESSVLLSPDSLYFGSLEMDAFFRSPWPTKKIEDSMAAGESVEPLQASKVHKKAGFRKRWSSLSCRGSGYIRVLDGFGMVLGPVLAPVLEGQF